MLEATFVARLGESPIPVKNGLTAVFVKSPLATFFRWPAEPIVSWKKNQVGVAPFV